MKPTDIAALRALLAKATKEWRQGWVEKFHVFTPDGASMGPDRVLFRANTHFPFEDDVALAVAARNALPALLSELEAHRALAEAARETLANIRGARRDVDAGHRPRSLTKMAERLSGPLDVPGVRLHFRARDVVKHHPSGEEWMLAYANNERGEVAPCGWPGSLARSSDCSLILAATDAEYLAMLREWANEDPGRVHDGSDFRSAECKRQLAALESQ